MGTFCRFKNGKKRRYKTSIYPLFVTNLCIFGRSKTAKKLSLHNANIYRFENAKKQRYITTIFSTFCNVTSV